MKTQIIRDWSGQYLGIIADVETGENQGFWEALDAHGNRKGLYAPDVDKTFSEKREFWGAGNWLSYLILRDCELKPPKKPFTVPFPSNNAQPTTSKKK